jgi:outer membrane protein assembly factor BamA
MRCPIATSATFAAFIVMAATVPARAEECPGERETKILPLPVYATTPNEGNTFGVMPVFVRVCPDSKRTEWILAPSVTWNDIIHGTGTVRFYDYPDPDTSLSLVGSVSTRINYNALVLWQRLPTLVGALTQEVTLRVERNAFARFYGFGPDTAASAETSYTGLRAFANIRLGINLPAHLNVGLLLGAEHDGVEDQGVPDLPLAPQVFPDAPGMGGSTVISQGLDIRFDDRTGREYADAGWSIGLSGVIVEGLSGSPTFFRVGATARGIVPELSWLSGAARLSWTGVTADDVPFFQQSQLGGAFLLRGFTEGRFTDRQAWTIELEQRIRILQTSIFGVVTDWRVDPFIASGQVFGNFNDAFSNPQVAWGVGLRAFVHPSLVGRIDLATGGEGLKVYVEIGYPY